MAVLSFEAWEFAWLPRLPLSCCALALVASWLEAVPLGWVLLFLFNLLGVVLWFVTTDVSPLAIVVGPFECRPLDTLPRLLVFWDDEGFISFNLDCHYLWGILWGFTGVLRLRGVSGSNPADIETATADISSLSLTSSHGRERQINLPIFIFPPLCFHEKKQYGIVKFVLQCFFQPSSSWIELWLRQELDFLFWGIQIPSSWPCKSKCFLFLFMLIKNFSLSLDIRSRAWVGS